MIVSLALLYLGWVISHRATPAPDRPMLAVAPADPRGEARIVYVDGKLPTLAMPDGRMRTIKSLLNIQKPMQFGDHVWNDKGVATGPVWVRVDMARQTLSVFRGGHEIGTTVILFGASEKPTPAGVFPVLAKAQQHRSNLYDAEMPFMLRLTRDGIAIHASTVREGAATHGCVGIPLDFARLLFDAINVGDEVALIAA